MPIQIRRPLQYLPRAALASIVFLIGVELVDLAGLSKVLQVQPLEFVVAAITAAAVIVVCVEQAILLAMALSLLEHVRQGSKPTNKPVGSLVVHCRRRRK